MRTMFGLVGVFAASVNLLIGVLAMIAGDDPRLDFILSGVLALITAEFMKDSK